MAFEVFHNVQEAIVDIGLVAKLNLDLVEVAERILLKTQSQCVVFLGQSSRGLRSRLAAVVQLQHERALVMDQGPQTQPLAEEVAAEAEHLSEDI